jgi:rRNA-processing protein FCF1
MESSRERAPAILFDSNFLMTAARLHFDLFQSAERTLDSPFDAQILSTNLRELRNLAQHSTPIFRNQARVALMLAERCRVLESSENNNDPDEELLRFASSYPRTIIATNDAALRRKLRRAGCPVLYLRRSGDLNLSGYAE